MIIEKFSDDEMIILYSSRAQLLYAYGIFSISIFILSIFLFISFEFEDNILTLLTKSMFSVFYLIIFPLSFISYLPKHHRISINKNTSLLRYEYSDYNKTEIISYNINELKEIIYHMSAMNLYSKVIFNFEDGFEIEFFAIFFNTNKLTKTKEIADFANVPLIQET